MFVSRLVVVLVCVHVFVLFFEMVSLLVVYRMVRI